MSLRTSASQTVGPYFRIGMAWLYRPDLFGPEVAGPRLEVSGRVLDGQGAGVDGTVLEFWQADAQGRYPAASGRAEASSRLGGFGRVEAGAQGGFRFTTILPGPVGLQAPHVAVAVFARGLMRPLLTRLYFPGQPGNATDPVLAAVPDTRRATLLARAGSAPDALAWDIVLQGPGETVFFDA